MINSKVLTMKKKLLIQLGKRIKILRKQRGVTQAQLAELVSLSTNFIGYIERGVQSPSISTLEKIAEVLRADIGMLFINIDRPLLKPDKKEKMVNKIISRTGAMEIDDIKLLLKLIRRLSG